MSSNIFKHQASTHLQTALNNPKAQFRDGQLEAIHALTQERARLLVVQRTGWGKSIVYFIATKILRSTGNGPTIIISPLLALIRNQIEAATRLGLTAQTINSDNKEDWEEIEIAFKENRIDVLFISPERLANQAFSQSVLIPTLDSSGLGLLVVDEAHCISDWGHDFRPDYRRIVRLLNLLPTNVPALATTATANNRVVKDIKLQLGNSLRVIRGNLIRDSLRLQTIPFGTKGERLAWLTHFIPKLPGSGIIYTLTVRDAEVVADWLILNDIRAAAYFGGQEGRVELEQGLLNNELKVLVSTSALGMGFDKPDLGFVIHYQRPGSIVAYYQQVGRAGRAIDRAYGILLSGSEDDDILNYFQDNAFPAEAYIKDVLQALSDAENGLSRRELDQALNIRSGKINHVLRLLSAEEQPPVTKQGSRWFRTAVAYTFDQEKVEKIRAIRQAEQEQMAQYLGSSDCLMQFLQTALDDPAAKPCGHCSPCRGKDIVSREIDLADLEKANQFLKRSYVPIEPRKQWPKSGMFTTYKWEKLTIPVEYRAERGYALCSWGDSGWGMLVKNGKQRDKVFDTELVNGVVEMIQAHWQPEPLPTWITAVPSLNNPTLVPRFAKQVANHLGIPFVPAVKKVRPTEPQKLMQNNFNQAKNLDGAFQITGWDGLNGNVILIDDMIDSGWTLSIVATLLREAGSGLVYPMALAKVKK